ncbi:MAG: UDP-N-acetylmuramoyl-L-alanyl-D-glutamate--2,6-diaminopimelate ligase [Actinomyces sp.]|jgi:UDP-N-acetylmuramoyl-L-alanyl-D-glutamate--2,6-diaminopimelate ligase|nr:UDP-N-acetylmuramoyl-L-alanyl-D-glutamate--2,6-diaminopimelate ligase [Actinomyces sp.]
MSSLSEIRPQTTALPLDIALEGCGTWQMWTDENGLVDPSDTLKALPVTGVSVSTDDLDTDWVFVGIPGAHRHGASLGETARLGGASIIVTDQDGAQLAQDAGLPIVVVSDPRRTAAIMATNLHTPAQKDLVIAGVTGTNGKTTTTYFLRSALASGLGQMGLFGTLEVNTGSLSVAAHRTTHEAPVVHRALAATAQAGLRGAVVEVSSHALSLGRVDGVDFDLAIFTNLQHDHLDFYENSMDLYFEAKASLFEPSRARVGVSAVDDEYGRRLVRQAQVPMHAVQVLTDDDLSDLAVPLWRVTGVTPNRAIGGNTFTLTDPSGTEYQAVCPIPGLVNVQDAALAIVGAGLLGVPIQDAIDGVANAPAVPGRMQWVPSLPNQPLVLVDFAHTPEALERLLLDMRPLCHGEVILVFGTDGDRDPSKRVPLGEVAAQSGDRLWVTDENPRWEDAQAIRTQILEGVRKTRPSMKDVIEVTTCRRDAIREAIYSAREGDVVIISGKGPETYQDIRGVKHAFEDAAVASEVLAAYAK